MARRAGNLGNGGARRRNRSSRTKAGEHVAVMLRRVMGYLRPVPGEIVVDCTLGYGGHAGEFLRRIAPGGRLIGMDVDATELRRTARRLELRAADLSLHRRNFAELGAVLADEGLDGVDVIFADLGVSSMQIDDPSRGIGYAHDGPLDMRMDNRIARTGAEVLAAISREDLSASLAELADEPDHRRIAEWIVAQRRVAPIQTVHQLVALVLNAKGFSLRGRHRPWEVPGGLHPAARTFQALRMMVNDELGSLRRLLEAAPLHLRDGGRLGIISFHSGEDRLVKQHLRSGLEQGVYRQVCHSAICPTAGEISANPRSSSAKFRWARRA